MMMMMKSTMFLLAAIMFGQICLSLAETETWTYLLWNHADTDLESFMWTDMQEVLNSPAGGNVIAFVDRSAGCVASDDYKECNPYVYTDDMTNVVDKDGKPVKYDNGARVLRRIKGRQTDPESGEVKENGQVWQVIETIPGEVNMDDPNLLADFIKKYFDMYPSKYRALTYHDHGASYLGFGGDEAFPGKDDVAYSIMTLAQIQDGVKKGLEKMTGVDKLDIIGFDACLMSGFLVHNTLSEYTKYILASEDLEPGHGWDFKTLDMSAANPVAWGKKLIDGFIAYKDPYDAPNDSGDKTLSLVDCAKYPAYSDAMSKFVDVLGQVAKTKSKSAMKVILRAQSEAYKFIGAAGKEKVHLDMGDFLNKIVAKSAQCGRLGEVAKTLHDQYMAIQAYERNNGVKPKTFTGIHLSMPDLANKDSEAWWQLEKFKKDIATRGGALAMKSVKYINTIKALSTAAQTGAYSNDNSVCSGSVAPTPTPTPTPTLTPTPTPTTTTTTTSIEDYPTMPPEETPTPTEDMKSLCYGEIEIIEGCECHPTCAECGYKQNPTGPLDCTMCKDGSEPKDMNEETFTGSCGGGAPGPTPTPTPTTTTTTTSIEDQPTTPPEETTSAPTTTTTTTTSAPTPTTTTTTTSIEDQPTTPPEETTAAPDMKASWCYDESYEPIEGCECHPTCSACGYNENPTGPLDCIACKDGSEVKQVYDDGSGSCGGVPPEELPTTKPPPEIEPLPFFVRNVTVRYNEEYNDFELDASVPDTAVRGEFQIMHTTTSEPGTVFGSSVQKASLMESYEDEESGALMYAYWLGDTFGLYQSVNGTDDPRLAFTQPNFSDEYTGKGFESLIYAEEEELDNDGDQEADEILMTIPVMYYPSGAKIQMSGGKPTTRGASPATLKMSYNLVTYKETAIMFTSPNNTSPTEIAKKNGGFFVPRLFKEVNGVEQEYLSDAVFLWGDILVDESCYDGESAAESAACYGGKLLIDYYNVLSTNEGYNKAPKYKDIVVQLHAYAMNGAEATKRFTFPLQALQNKTFTDSSFSAGPEFSDDGPAVEASITLSGVSKESFESESTQQMFKESVAFVANVEPEQVMITGVRDSMIGRMIRRKRRKLAEGGGVVVDFAILPYKNQNADIENIKAAISNNPEKLVKAMTQAGVPGVSRAVISKVLEKPSSEILAPGPPGPPTTKAPVGATTTTTKAPVGATTKAPPAAATTKAPPAAATTKAPPAATTTTKAPTPKAPVTAKTTETSGAFVRSFMVGVAAIAAAAMSA